MRPDWDKASVRSGRQYLMRQKCQNQQFVFMGKKREKWLVIRRFAGDLAGLRRDVLQVSRGEDRYRVMSVLKCDGHEK